MRIQIIKDENEQCEPIDAAMEIINSVRDRHKSFNRWKDEMAFIDEVADHIKTYTEHSRDRWERRN